jgi:hypothetical protein
MAGTPFDQKINDVYAAWREVQQKERKPFVTVLRAGKGDCFWLGQPGALAR